MHIVAGISWAVSPVTSAHKLLREERQKYGYISITKRIMRVYYFCILPFFFKDVLQISFHDSTERFTLFYFFTGCLYPIVFKICPICVLDYHLFY